MSQLYDPHVNIALPILQFEIIELDKIRNKAERIFNFRITNLTRFFMDLSHFDPEFKLSIKDLQL